MSFVNVAVRTVETLPARSVEITETVLMEQAESTLKAKGFRVARTDVDSNEPAETVLRQDPGGNAMVPQGSTVTLTSTRRNVSVSTTTFPAPSACAT